MGFKVLDTNIVLHGAQNVITLGLDGSIVVIPETAIDEIDSKKSVQGEIGYQAREFGRLLTRSTKGKYTYLAHKHYHYVPYTTPDGTVVWIVGLREYPTDITFEEKHIKNDRKIIHVASILNTYEDDVVFYTNDIMCGIRAEPLGIRSSELREVEETEFEFTKSMTVSDEVFRNLHNQPILDIDPDYVFEHHNYKFMNEYTEQIKLATIDLSGRIDILGKVTEQDLRRQDINPANADQLLFSYHIQNPTTDVVIAEAKAGTGKTIVALSNAMALIKRNNQYQSIIYVRASIDDVDDQEAVGFLPGYDEKFAHFYEPLNDSLRVMAENRYKKTKGESPDEYEERIVEKIAKLKIEYNITAMTGLGLRGRTLPSGAIIIIDEPQSQTKNSLQKMLTRPGKDSLVIITGSNLQIDNPYVTKFNNGLSVLLEEASKGSDIVNIRAVSLPKIVRSKHAEWAETIYSKRK